MAQLFLQQTDTAAVDGAIAACSGRGAGAVTDNKQATSGGTPGVGTPGLTINGHATDVRLVHFESAVNEPNNTNWDAGSWIVRLNITTGNANVTWDECYICRVNSSGVSQATVGSLTGQAINLTSTGTYTMTISGSSQPGASATDRIYIVLVFSNSGATPAALNYKPSLIIDTPIGTGVIFPQNILYRHRKRNPTVRAKRHRRFLYEPLYALGSALTPLLLPALSRPLRKKLRPTFQKRRRKFPASVLFPAIPFALFKLRTRKRNKPTFQKLRKKLNHAVVLLNVLVPSIFQYRSWMKFRRRPKYFHRTIRRKQILQSHVYPPAKVDSALFKKRRFKYRIPRFRRFSRYKPLLYPGLAIPSALFRKRRFRYRVKPFWWTKRRRYQPSVTPGATVGYIFKRKRRLRQLVFARRRADYRFKVELFPIFQPSALFGYRPWMKFRRRKKVFHRTLRRKQVLFTEPTLAQPFNFFSIMRRKRRYARIMRAYARINRRRFVSQLFPGTQFDGTLFRKRRRRSRLPVRMRTRAGRVIVVYLPTGRQALKPAGNFQEPARGGF
jgi:hypothetical protein